MSVLTGAVLRLRLHTAFSMSWASFFCSSLGLFDLHLGATGRRLVSPPFSLGWRGLSLTRVTRRTCCHRSPDVQPAQIKQRVEGHRQQVRRLACELADLVTQWISSPILLQVRQLRQRQESLAPRADSPIGAEAKAAAEDYSAPFFFKHGGVHPYIYTYFIIYAIQIS